MTLRYVSIFIRYGILVTLLLFAIRVARAQPYNNIAAAGMSYNHGASPSIAGTAAYARLLSPSTETYNFTVIDALPTSIRPFVVTNQTATGILQRVPKLRNVYVPIAAGVSWAGTNTGWAWTTGVLVAVPVKGAHVFPNVRVVKSSVNNNSGYQLIVGVMFGKGWN